MRGHQGAVLVFAAQRRADQRDGVDAAFPGQRTFAADGAQFIADPGIDGGRRQGIGTGPTYIVILQAES